MKKGFLLLASTRGMRSRPRVAVALTTGGGWFDGAQHCEHGDQLRGGQHGSGYGARAVKRKWAADKWA
jgi:hypothetical protein